MKNVLEKFDSIVKLMDKVNSEIIAGGFENTTGYEPRFRKLFQSNGKRVQSIGVYDYHTKKHVLFEMVNMVGNKNMPQELFDMERLVLDARSN